MLHTAQVNSLKQLMEDQIQTQNRHLNSLQNQLNSLQHDASTQFSELEQQLARQQSLFSQTDLTIKPEKTELAVTMRAIPKDQAFDEVMIACIPVNGQSFEPEPASQGTAVIRIPLTDAFTPSFVIRSETGIRQESLEEQYPLSLLSCYAYAFWNEENILRIDIHDTSEKFPFTKEDLASAEFRIIDTGQQRTGRQGGGSGSASIGEIRSIDGPGLRYFKENAGTVVPAQELPAVGIASYSMDFSDYAAQSDGYEREVYFSFTTKDGLCYLSTIGPVATFAFSENSSHHESGNETLYPILN